jgi:PEP-CTERM motif
LHREYLLCRREPKTMRAFRYLNRVAVPTAVVAIALAAPRAAAQIVVYDSNGFEPYSMGNISGQQGFQAFPTPSAGTIEGGTVNGGSKAFQIVGSQLVSTSALGYGDANFWYQSFSVPTAFNPVARGTPVVRLAFDGRVSGALPLPSDIPFGGPYMEAYTPTGNPLDQQAITPILLNTNGGITVFTNSLVGGSDKLISSADGLFPRETWVHVEALLDFASQSFRVLLNGTPVTFSEGAFSGTDVPFRNTNGPTISIAELGLQGYYNASFNPTFNNMYFDNVTITGLSPVPEPSSFALAGLALAGLAARLRKRESASRQAD